MTRQVLLGKVISSTARQSLRCVLVPIIQQFCFPPSGGMSLIDGIDVKDDSPSSRTLAFYAYSPDHVVGGISESSPMHAEFYILNLTKGIHLGIGLRGKSSGEETM